MKRIECFNIQLLVSEDLFDITEAKAIKRIMCEPYRFLKEPLMIVADPFLFVKDDVLYLFYEEKKLYHPGVISMICTKDLENWSDPVVVLSEDYHLSFPWVFEEDGRIFMLPETGEDHSIHLYEAKDVNLKTFKYYRTLLRGEGRSLYIDYADSIIYKSNGKYYLMTTVMEKEADPNCMELHVGDTLFGPYRKHPMSPIIKSRKFGRNAGNLFEREGRLFRVAQDCEYRYGDDVHLMEITELTDNTYKENLFLENLLAGKKRFYKEGGHQYSWVEFKGRYIIATDAKAYHTFLAQRVLHKLGAYK